MTLWKKIEVAFYSELKRFFYEGEAQIIPTISCLYMDIPAHIILTNFNVFF